MSGDKGGGTEWMYNSGKQVDQEDYLLGKQIGKDFDNEGTMGQINAVEYDCAPPSIFASRAGHQVDLQRKLVEDPLVAIKKRELEDRKKLLDNPLKMKALREHIDSLKKAKKEKKKKKKKKKDRGKDSDSDTDLDLALLTRLEKIEGRQQDQDRRTIMQAEEKERQAAPKPTVYTDKEERDTPPREDRKNRKFDPNDLKNERYSHRRDRSRSRDRPRPYRSHQQSRRSRSRSPPPAMSSRYQRRSRSRDRSPVMSRRRQSRSVDRSPRNRRSRSRDSSPHRRRRSRSKTPTRKEVRDGRSDHKKDRKQDDANKEAEKAKKLAEMMENAKWREEQRANRVNAYRKAVEEEENLKDHDPEFLQRELRKAAANSSVESRIKSNKHNIQRGVTAMDSNFARR